MPRRNATRPKKGPRIQWVLRLLYQKKIPPFPPLLLLVVIPRAPLQLGHLANPRALGEYHLLQLVLQVLHIQSLMQVPRVKERTNTSQSLPSMDCSCRNPLDQKAIQLVQFILRKYNMREPIVKEDMIKHVIKKYKKHFHEIFKKASE